MLSIIFDLETLICKSNRSDDFKIEDGPKLTIIKDNETFDTSKCTRALTLTLNDKVNVRLIELNKYELKTDHNDKFCPKEDWRKSLLSCDLVIKQNNKEEQSEVLILLGDVNINNIEEFNKKYRKKLDEECLILESILLCRLAKLELFKDLTTVPYLECFGKMRMGFERALYGEVWENISSFEVESIILHFVSLRTRVYQGFLMYNIINIIEMLFYDVFVVVAIVNGEGKTLENKEGVLYIFKEAIKRCKHKFNIQNPCTTNESLFHNENIINCIMGEIDETLKIQYPLEEGVSLFYTLRKDIEDRKFPDEEFYKIILKFFDNHFARIKFFIHSIDPLFKGLIRIQQHWLIKNIGWVKSKLRSFKNMHDYSYYISMSLYIRQMYVIEETLHKEIYEECVTVQTKLLERIKLLEYEEKQIKIFDSLINDNVAFKIRLVPRDSKKYIINTKYYRFVSLTEIKEISEDKSYKHKGFLLSPYIIILILILVVLVFFTAWSFFMYIKIGKNEKRRETL